MKKNRILFGLISALTGTVGFCSCEPDYETEFEVKSLVVPDNSLAAVSFPVEGGESEVAVETNVEFSQWHASSNADWLSVEKREEKVLLAANNNDTYAARTARVTIEYGYQAYSVDVSQAGKTPYLLVDGERDSTVLTLSGEENTFSATVKSNITVDHVLIPDTANFVQLVGIEEVEGSGDEKTATFKVDRNLGSEQRYSTITLQSSDNYFHTASFLIIQQAVEFVEIPLRVEMLSSNALETAEGSYAGLLDGNASTYFHSAYTYTVSEAHYLQVKLDEEIDGCALWYQNRNNTNGKPSDVSIMTSADGTNWTLLTNIASGLPTTAGSTYNSPYLSSESPFRYLRFVVNETNDGAAPTFFCMAELKLYGISE